MTEDIGYKTNSEENTVWRNIASKPNINTGKPPTRMYQVTENGAGTYKPNPASKETN